MSRTARGNIEHIRELNNALNKIVLVLVGCVVEFDVSETINPDKHFGI